MKSTPKWTHDWEYRGKSRMRRMGIWEVWVRQVGRMWRWRLMTDYGWVRARGTEHTLRESWNVAMGVLNGPEKNPNWYEFGPGHRTGEKGNE